MKKKQRLLICISFLFFCFPLIAMDEVCETPVISPMKRRSMSYRGKRLQPQLSEFYIVGVMARKMNSGLLAITFVFNAPIDPRTISTNSISINKLPLPPTIKLDYNKEGTAMRLCIPQTVSKSCDIKINGIESFNGLVLEEYSFENISDGYQKNFEKD